MNNDLLVTMIVLNDIKNSFLDAIKTRRQTPALITMYCFIDICASLADESKKKIEENERFCAYVDRYFDIKRPWTSFDLWAARCGITHAFSTVAKLHKSGRATPLYYFAYPERREQAHAVASQVVIGAFHLVSISDIKIACISSYNNLIRRAESEQAFGERFRSNGRNLVKSLQQVSLMQALSRLSPENA